MASVFTRPAAVVGLAALSLCLPAGVTAAAAGLRPLTSPRLQERYSPDPGQQNFLSSVQTLTARDAWAVGSYCKANCEISPNQRTLALHWNGIRWTHVPSPSPGVDDTLTSVSGSSPGNVWAVGDYLPRRGLPRPLVLRWSGGRWVRTRFVAFAKTENVRLSAVSVRSARDAWIVGFESDLNTQVTKSIAAHWNGSAWRLVPVPHPGSPSFLDAVSVASAKDAWAAGNYCASGCGGINEVRRGITLHWNGRKWSVKPAPVKSTIIRAIATLSATDAWATGYLNASHGSISVTLHWNGKHWSSVSGVPGVFPQALAFGAKDDGWAPFSDVSMRWNGTSWHQVTIPGPETSSFTGASAAGRADVWVVGVYCPPTKCSGASAVADTLAMHWNGRTWTRK